MLLFLSRTIDLVAASSASARCAASLVIDPLLYVVEGFLRPMVPAAPDVPVLATLKRNFSRRMRSVALLRSFWFRVPGTSDSSTEKLRLFGSSMSMPAFTASPAFRGRSVPAGFWPPGIAHQSESTKPLKPNSVRSIVFSRSPLCVALTPRTRL